MNQVITEKLGNHRINVDHNAEITTPTGWTNNRLSDALCFLGGNAFKSTDLAHEGIKWLKIANVGFGKVEWDTVDYLPYQFENEYTKFLLSEGDIVMALTRPILGEKLKIAKVDADDAPALLNQRVAKLVANEGYSIDYLYHYLSKTTTVAEIGNAIAGTDPPNLGFNDLRKVRICTPPIEEQQKIASILSTWEKAIELKEKLIEQKKEQKKGLMQKLLTGKSRLRGFEGEWEVKEIKKISKVYRGASPRPISDSKWFDDDSRIGWVRISDVTKSKKYLTQTEQYLSVEGVKKSRFIQANNIIMSICATVGKPIVTGFDVCIHDGFVVFDELSINQDYFYYYLLKLEDGWSKYGQTGSQMNLNTDIVGNEKIFFPLDKNEQQAIADVLANADKEIDLLNDEVESIRFQKKGLMQLLLTGKVRVKV